VQLPSDLISITRGQLTSLIDATLKPYTGPTNTPKQRARKLQHERLEADRQESSLWLLNTINGWMDHPDTEAVLVLEMKDLTSTFSGSVQFMRLGPKCSTQLEQVNHQTRVGDVPSRTRYASYYCATLPTIAAYIRSGEKPKPFPYGPFFIYWEPERQVYVTKQRDDTEVLSSERGRFKLPIVINDLRALLLHLDVARCSEQPFSDLR